MMFRVLALIAFIMLVYWGLNALTQRYSFTRTQSRWLLVIGISLTVIGTLIVMGRLPVQFILAPLGVAATFMLRMLPAFLRLVPVWQMLRNRNPFQGQGSRGQDNHKSVIRTEYLDMELDHGSGDMDGRIIKGRFEGQVLSSLALEQLMELAGECRSDQDSLQVLEAYLDRMHPDWQKSSGQARDSSESTAEEPAMNRQLALEILGLAEGASREDAIKAHRKLMQRMHPDRGGTEYLAKKINAARDYLVEHL